MKVVFIIVPGLGAGPEYQKLAETRRYGPTVHQAGGRDESHVDHVDEKGLIFGDAAVEVRCWFIRRKNPRHFRLQWFLKFWIDRSYPGFLGLGHNISSLVSSRFDSLVEVIVFKGTIYHIEHHAVLLQFTPRLEQFQRTILWPH